LLTIVESFFDAPGALFRNVEDESTS
jgi:hypothetical protein